MQQNCTVEFVAISRIGNRYAKFISVADRNQVLFNTEDRTQWYVLGKGEENDFVEHIVPKLGIDLRINPEKTKNYGKLINLIIHKSICGFKDTKYPVFYGVKIYVWKDTIRSDLYSYV